MSGPGRPTTPTEVKRRRGTLREDRLTSIPVPVAPVPSDYAPPEHLDEAGQALWHHIIETCRWIAASDIAVLTLVCEAVDRRAKLLDQLAYDGYVLTTDKGYRYAHPAAGVLATLEKQLTSWMSSLGLTPSDRGKLGLTEVKAASALDRLAAERSSRIPPDGRPES